MEKNFTIVYSLCRTFEKFQESHHKVKSTARKYVLSQKWDWTEKLGE